MIKYLFVLLFGPVLIPGAALLVKLPELLEKRLIAKEKEGARKGVAAASALLFIADFIAAGSKTRKRFTKTDFLAMRNIRPV